MPIPLNVCFLWPGTNASIPAGWARETLIAADRYPKGAAAGVDPGATGGANLHTHTSVTHVHTGNHTHTVADSPAGSGATSRDTGTTNPPDTHTHDTNPATGESTTNLTTEAPASGLSSAQLSFFRVIIIKSDGTPTGVPDLAVAIWNDPAGAPTNWNLCDGGGAPARPDMRNFYLVQAAAGGDGGSTGGALTHTHTLTSHVHGTTYNHAHTGSTSSQKTQANTAGSISGAQVGTATSTHTHALTFGTSSATITGSADSLAASNHEPPFSTQAFIQNNAGAADWPDRVIGLWMQTLASIPTDWALCDGTLGTPDLRALFVKGANVLGDIGVTGGSLTHTHTAAGHTHASLGTHTHTTTVAAGAGENRTAGAVSAATTAHTHPSWANTGATSFASGSTTPVINDFTDTQPQFTGAAFIQWQAPTGAAVEVLIATGYSPEVLSPDLQEIHDPDLRVILDQQPGYDDVVAVLFPPEVLAAIEELIAAGYSPAVLSVDLGEVQDPDLSPVLDDRPGYDDVVAVLFPPQAPSQGVPVGSLAMMGAGR